MPLLVVPARPGLLACLKFCLKVGNDHLVHDMAPSALENIVRAPPRPASFDRLKAESFIRGESTLAVLCDAPFDDVAARLQGSLAANGLAVVHVHEFDRLLAARGFDLGMRARVYEVCDARLAANLFALDPGLAHVLPCRIAMHDHGGVVTVTTSRPVVLMAEFSHAASVARLARSFEAGLQRVLQAIQP